MRRFIAVLPAFVRLLRLSWSLLTDRRIPLRLKAIPAIALSYILSPLDLVPDVLPLLGQLDDVVVATGLLALFASLAPAAIARAEAQRTARRTNEDRGTVIDGKFHYIDED